MFGSGFIATLTLAIAVAANPLVQVRDTPVTLSIAKRFNFTGSATLIERDQARASGLRKLAEAKLNGKLDERAVISVPVTNGLVDYTANVRIHFSICSAQYRHCVSPI